MWRMSVSDVTLIWETETDMQYSACTALYCVCNAVMQPLTADSGPFDLRHPPLRDSKQPLCRILNLQTFYPAKGRQPPPESGHSEGVSQDIFAAVDTRWDIVPQKLYQKT